MNNFTEVLDTITRLIDSKKVSNYRIQKDTGVSYGAISELRNGKRKIKNLTLDTAEKLYNYQKQLEIIRELENQMVELENQHDIVLLKSLGRYFIDIENNGENYFNIEYVLLNKVEYTNANVYFEIEIHRIKEVPFMDVVTEDNIDEFEMKWFDLDQSTETYIESVFFENEEDAKSYINFVLKGYNTFKAVAKAIGLIE